MKKNPMVSSIVLGAVLGVLTLLVGQFWSADWPVPPTLMKLSIFGLVVGVIVARCVYMALVPKKGSAEPSSL